MPAASLPVDKLDVLILVDDATDGLSTVPANVETEFASATRRGLRASSGRCLCGAVHGLSCLITAQRGELRHAVLFEPATATATCHSTLIRMFRSRAMRMPNGGAVDGRRSSVADLTAQGARVVCTTEPQGFLDDMLHVGGEIPRVTPFEVGLPGQVRRAADGKDWEPDEQLVDERWLGVHVVRKGLVVFSACSHAGIVNVLTHARASFPDVPIHAVFRGLHMPGPNEQIIPQTVAAMKPFAPALIGAGHCTGWRALAALAEAFGDKVLAPTAVGKRYSI